MAAALTVAALLAFLAVVVWWGEDTRALPDGDEASGRMRHRRDVWW